MKILVIQVKPEACEPENDIEADVECQSVHTLEAGIVALSDSQFDCVVADSAALMYPDSTRLRRTFQRTQTPTSELILCVSPEEEIAIDTLSAGVDGCLPAPLRLSTVQDLLSRRVALDRNLLEQRAELRRKDEEIAILVAVSNIVTSNLEFIPLLQAIAHQTSEALLADRATIFMYDGQVGKLNAAFAEGLGPHSISIPATHGIAGYVATQRTLVNVTNAYQDTRFYNEIDLDTGYTTHTILCAPMTSPNGDLIGVVQCLNKRVGSFTEANERMLSMLTPLFAIAVENALLYKDLQEEVQHTEQMTAEKIRAERFAVVGRMARSVTRDITGPMEAIVAHATKLGCETIPLQDRETTSRAIEEVVDHLVGLTQQLLDFSRETIEITRKPSGVLQFISLLELTLQKGSCLFHSSDVPPVECQALLDTERLIQAFTCVATVLTGNEQNSVNLSVHVSKTQLCFTFSPLSAATVTSVMRLMEDPFASPDEEHTIGMKMAVAKRIIDSHEGRFFQEGSDFSIYIPIQLTGGV